MKKTCILMRHAKSDWNQTGLVDFARPLNARGREACDIVGHYFNELEIIADGIICSSAKRTSETAERVIAATGWEKPVIHQSDKLYLCSPRQLVQEIEKTSPQVNTLLVINHQPTCGEVIHSLCNQWVEMKTASFAIIDCSMEDWGLFDSCEKKLLSHLTPKQIQSKHQIQQPKYDHG